MQQCSCTNTIIIGIIVCLLVAGIPAVMAVDATSSAESNISVNSWPAGAAVYINSEYRGVTPIKLEHLSPGRYMIDLSLAGYANQTFTRTISAGSRHEIGFTLEPLSSLPAPTGSGSIAVDSNPGGASVLLDGNTVGTTRMDGYAFNVNNVPAGNHSVTVELAGYPVYTSTVTVSRNQVVKVTADFMARTPTIPGTPIVTTDRREPVPLSPLTAIAAAGLIGLAAIFRRS